MRISYRTATFAFALLYVGLVAGMGFIAGERIRVSEVAFQRFLQDQVDVDRQIVSQRASLNDISRRVRSQLLSASSRAGDASFLHKPFQDVILFLRDMRAGKRGQRLYFGTPIREVKESEEIINDFVAKAEEHEREELPKK